MKQNTALNSKRIALALKKNNVAHIFGQSNPPSVTLACMDEGIRQVGYRQENAGGYMAQAYGMCSGKVPVVTAQNGPAATLLVPPLAECFKAGHPVVALVQEIARRNTDKNAFQEIDHHALYSGCAKWTRTIPCQERIEDYIDMAFIQASSGRPGPAVLLLPSDIINDFSQEYPIPANRKKILGTYPLDRPVADPAVVEEAVEILANAKNPIIYAGGGVVSSGAQNILRQIQEECSIPVATTTMGKGVVDDTHPLSMGPIGYYMGKRGYSKFLKPMVQEADVIVLVGNRTNQNGTDSWTLLSNDTQYIQIDIDAAEIGRNYEGIRLLGDAKGTLEALKAALDKKDLGRRQSARKKIEETIRNAIAAHVEEAEDVTATDLEPIRIERFLTEVNKQLDDDHIIVADASFSSVWIANYISGIKNRKFIFPRGLAGLGWGYPMAIGAAIAQPERKVFCLAGDGGFGHVWSELETAKREKANVVLAVINNEILGYQKWAETAAYGRSTNATDLTSVNHAQIAESVGISAICVHNASEITGAVKKAFSNEGPVLIDLYTEPQCIPPIPFMVDKLDNIYV